MKKSDNVINIQLSDNQGKLHIRIAGWYIPKDFDDYSFELFINGEKTECSIQHITREDKLDLLISNSLKRDCKIGFIIKADVNKSDVKSIELYVVDAGVRSQIASADEKDVVYTIQDQILQYNIDRIWPEKTTDDKHVYRVAGWGVAQEGDVTIDMTDVNNNPLEFKNMRCERLDLIDNGYTEDEKKAVGFTITIDEKPGYVLHFKSDAKNIDINIDQEIKRQRRVYNIDKAKRMIKAITPHNVARLCHHIRLYGFKDLKEYVYGGLYGVMDQAEIYKKWFAIHKVTQEELDNQKKAKFDYEPKISIIVPTYNTPVKYLEEMIQSVIDQSYSNWQLCKCKA